jgi:hypothetical protein
VTRNFTIHASCPKRSAEFPRPQIRRSDSRQWAHSSDHPLDHPFTPFGSPSIECRNMPPNSTTTSRSSKVGSDPIVLLIYIRRRRRGWKPPSTSRWRISIEKDEKAHALAQPPSAHPGGRKSSFLAPRLGKSDIPSFPSCSPSGKHITFVSAESGRAVDGMRRAVDVAPHGFLSYILPARTSVAFAAGNFGELMARWLLTGSTTKLAMILAKYGDTCRMRGPTLRPRRKTELPLSPTALNHRVYQQFHRRQHGTV